MWGHYKMVLVWKIECAKEMGNLQLQFAVHTGLFKKKKLVVLPGPSLKQHSLPYFQSSGFQAADFLLSSVTTQQNR